MKQTRFEYVSDAHFSNCAVEAFKAKIFSGRRVRVYFCKPRFRNGQFRLCHFMWTDGVADYDFSDEDCFGELPFWRYFVFKGRIRKFPLGFAKKYSKFRNKKRRRS